MDKVSVWYLSKKDTDRDLRMKARFEKLNISSNLVEWVTKEWLIENGYSKKVADTYKDYNCMWGHIKMIKQFLKTDKEYGMILEDDVYINKNLPNDIGFILSKMKHLELDILLIGYLTDRSPVKVEGINCHNIIVQGMSICSYHDELWGTQGYIITRKHAEYVLSKYDESYVTRFPNKEEKIPFSADWTITKSGKRASIYPMYIVEEGTIASTHAGQVAFHKNCHSFNYKKELFV